jgi:diguanylate cyclase (GGDEF)-like protein
VTTTRRPAPTIKKLADTLSALAGLARELEALPEESLEAMLEHVARCTAGLLECPRISVRLLDPTRTRLVAACRAGAPLHVNAGAEFRLGEGLVGWIAERHQPVRTGDAESDSRFQHRPDQVEWMGSFLGVPLTVRGACVGVLSAVNPRSDYFTDEHEDLLTLLAAICVPRVEMARLYRLAQIDPLTGALNAGGLDLLLHDRAQTESTAVLSVIIANVDELSRINDEHGLKIGDEVLRRIAEILSRVVRESDSVVRVGDGEFLLVLPAIDLQTAARVAERARKSVGEAEIAALRVPLRVTLTLGVAQRRPQEARDGLMARAAAAVARAKSDGRNRVQIAD